MKKKISYLTISIPKQQKKKEVNIISLQQVVGRHIMLPKENNTIKNKFINKTKENPTKYKLINNEKVFSIFGPNKTDITYSGNGTSPWTFVIGHKGVRKQIHMLLIGERIWGIELDMGIKMRSNANKLGNERLITFLKNQIDSMLEDDSSWDTIEVFCRD